MISIDASKITFTKGFLISVLIAALLIAPSWYLFQFHNQLFISTDIPKLILILIGISCPVVIINLIIVGISMQKPAPEADEKQKENFYFATYSYAGLLTILVFYTPSLVFFIDPTIPENAVNFCIISEAIILVLAIMDNVERKLNKKVLAEKSDPKTLALTNPKIITEATEKVDI